MTLRWWCAQCVTFRNLYSNENEHIELTPAPHFILFESFKIDLANESTRFSDSTATTVGRQTSFLQLLLKYCTYSVVDDVLFHFKATNRIKWLHLQSKLCLQPKNIFNQVRRTQSKNNIKLTTLNASSPRRLLKILIKPYL